MADLLPSRPDTSTADEADPRVIGLDSDDADALLSALSSDTAREVLAALHETPDSPAAIADRVGTSLQNAQYHLGNLEDADLIEVIDTVYSEKGREMKVYAPADRPLVVFAGSADESDGLESALKRLLGAVGILSLASLLVQFLVEGVPSVGMAASDGAGGAGGSGGDGGGVSTMSVETAQVAAQTGPSIPPGVLFFLGGATILAVGVAVWYVRTRR